MGGRVKGGIMYGMFNSYEFHEYFDMLVVTQDGNCEIEIHLGVEYFQSNDANGGNHVSVGDINPQA